MVITIFISPLCVLLSDGSVYHNDITALMMLVRPYDIFVLFMLP